MRSSSGSSRVQEKATVEPDGVLPPLRLQKVRERAGDPSVGPAATVLTHTLGDFR